MKRNTEHVLEFCYIAMDRSGFDEIPWSVLQKRLKAHSDTIFGNWELFKNDEKCLYFTLKALFVPKIFKFLSWLFGLQRKTAWLER